MFNCSGTADCAMMVAFYGVWVVLVVLFVAVMIYELRQ
jgi:hypothetical protein